MSINQDDQFDRELGFRLKALRQKSGVSQKQLGELLGISFQQVQKYESGANRMPPERIEACAKLFNVPVSYFFGSQVEAKDKVVLDRKVINIALAISAIPSEEVQRKLYHMVLSMNDNLTGKRDKAA